MGSHGLLHPGCAPVLLSACLQAAFLIPVSVCIYTATGGLKATFLSSYIHTVIIYVALCIFAFTTYATGPDLGSPKKVRGGRLSQQPPQLCLQAVPVAHQLPAFKMLALKSWVLCRLTGCFANKRHVDRPF